ncbi:oxidoreductase [Vibrio mytili]|uniref:oxidoreductase n=1 Tax=Vibrio mytili TaxID=50718 RepID=UPI003C6FB539
MKKIIALILLVFSTFISAHEIVFSGSQKTDVSVTLEQLQALPITSYTTNLPWISAPAKFDGVKLSTLLTQIYGSIPEYTDIAGLNNYHSILPRQDILRYEPILAFKKDGQYIKIRDKGPYWVVYPLSSYPEIDRTEYHAQMVWQVSQIEMKK